MKKLVLIASLMMLGLSGCFVPLLNSEWVMRHEG
jgi:hypothetical protein